MDGTADAAERRRQVLEALRFERQQARAAALSASPAAADSTVGQDQRSATHDAVMQRIMSQRGHVAPVPVRSAWEEHRDRQASKLQEELGLSEPRSSHHGDARQGQAAHEAGLGARGASALPSAAMNEAGRGALPDYSLKTRLPKQERPPAVVGSPPPYAAVPAPSSSGIPPPSPKVKTGRATTAKAATLDSSDEAAAAKAAGASNGSEAYTFQPKINSRSVKLAEKRDGSCYSRLSSQRAEAYAKRELQRMDMERERLEDCTFTPRINTPKAGVGRKSVGGGGGASGGAGGGNRRLSAGERLHHDADRKAEMLERKRVASERWEVSSHRFQPHINPTSSMIAAEGGQAPL